MKFQIIISAILHTCNIKNLKVSQISYSLFYR